MNLFNRFILRIKKSTNLRNTSSFAETMELSDEILPSIYTRETDPVYHNESHLNKLYNIPSKDCATILSHGLMNQYKIQLKIFNEMSILIRKPSIELLSYLSKSDYAKPVNKYVIYGECGSGKSTLLYHLLHYGYNTNKIIVYVNHAQYWFTKPKEIKYSEIERNIIDLPIDTRIWLDKFKLLNNHILCQANIKLSKSYKWGTGANFPKDSSLIDLINFGIDQTRYASEIVAALVNELKQASRIGLCNVLVLIDNYNIFFSHYTQIKNSLKKFALTSEFSLTQNFLEITKSDWCNGQIIVTVDTAVNKDRQESHLPRYLLTKEGFEHLDPFLPINVENYSEDEFYTMIDYYKHKKLIRSLTSNGEKELKLLSGYNPYKLMDLCKHL
ncbi:PREDICTED: 28S ribosomal protein S29, mitochondrial [Ceratosolen solmsi marchali]|uniref:Small ribosomal subunit protein mS29 n=1 Tax=Ceratosolen solmsi marchali TaxID=326594 RepID=A0AAJ6YF69_9HYME|nr:PREDICTED: 28S ribosomal protein S29, mitochondrial [Ceratosolen solmsi marchali]